jgi:hypothetical protein
MDEQRLAEIEAAHEPHDNYGRRWCFACDRPAPCDARTLLAEVRRLREALAYYATSTPYAFGITVREGQPVDIPPEILRDDCGHRARTALGIQ